MDVSREALLDELNDFEKKRPNDIPPLLEDYLVKIAKCGDTMFPWSKFKLLIRKKLEAVMSDFNEGCPTDNLPPVPNVELFKFEAMKCKILEAIDSFQSTPFTIQRLCELLTSPKKHYKRTDKFMRGIEKNILVVSTVEPSRHSELINNNGSLVVNGVLEVSTEGEMLMTSQQEVDSENNVNNNNNNNNNHMFGRQERVTVNGVPLPEGLFTTDPTPSSSSSTSNATSMVVAPEMESSSEDSSDSSTDSGTDYVLKEATLDVMTDNTEETTMSSPTRVKSCVTAEPPPLPDEDETCHPTVGNMDDTSEVDEDARQLLSQVTENIEENSLSADTCQETSKFPVTAAIMDSSLELGFNLGKDLSGECATGVKSPKSLGLSAQFESSSFNSSTEHSSVTESTSPVTVVETVEPVGDSPLLESESAVLSAASMCQEVDSGMALEAEFVSNVESSPIDINSEPSGPASERMETDISAEAPLSADFEEESQCSPADEEPSGNVVVSSDGVESAPLEESVSSPSPMVEVADNCPSLQPSEEPMDQD